MIAGMMLLALAIDAPAGDTAIRAEGPTRSARAAAALADLSAPGGPGIQYVVADATGVLFEQAVGLADIRDRIPLSPRHTMAAFSMTKTLTAIAILELIEAGKLDVDAALATYVPHPYDRGITIRHLLSHTSGIPNPIPLKWVHRTEEEASFDEPSALAAVIAANSRSAVAPGEYHFYSNINYWLLGSVVEAVSGESYSVYVRKHVFERLGLPPEEIGFSLNSAAPHAKGYLAKWSWMNLVKGLVTDQSVWGEYEGDWLRLKDVSVDGPAYGGAIGTARAFGVILQDLLREHSLLLGGRGKQLLFARQKLRNGRVLDMSLGWHVGRMGDIPYFFKEGGGAGFRSEMRIYPSRGLASVIMTNRTSFNARSALGTLDRVFLSP